MDSGLAYKGSDQYKTAPKLLLLYQSHETRDKENKQHVEERV